MLMRKRAKQQYLQQAAEPQKAQDSHVVNRIARSIKQYVYKEDESKAKVVEFELPETLVIQHMLGKGAYGTVVSAMDLSSGRKVAIKKVTLNGNPLLCQRTIREIKLLKHFNHPNIIQILSIPKPTNYNTFDSIYIVQELMTTDLSKIIKSTTELNPDVIKYIMWQLLQGVKAMHDANVLHRDLKPANILMDADCNLKICDFGLSRPVLSQTHEEQVLTQYVATRWYRAPELLMQSKYSKAIDIWSVGCIYAEVLSRRPICPGRDFIDQMRLSLEICGGLNEDNLAAVPGDDMRRFMKHIMGDLKLRSLDAMFAYVDKPMRNLLKELLAFDPINRATAKEALQMPCFDEFDRADVYPVAERITDAFFDFEKDLYTLNADVHRKVAVRELYM